MEARWEIINTQPVVPKCKLCDKTTDQMARFYIQPTTIYICSDCARYVKECMNKWTDLLEPGYVLDPTSDSDYVYRYDRVGGGWYIPNHKRKDTGEDTGDTTP